MRISPFITSALSLCAIILTGPAHSQADVIISAFQVDDSVQFTASDFSDAQWSATLTISVAPGSSGTLDFPMYFWPENYGLTLSSSGGVTLDQTSLPARTSFNTLHVTASGAGSFQVHEMAGPGTFDNGDPLVLFQSTRTNRNDLIFVAPSSNSTITLPPGIPWTTNVHLSGNWSQASDGTVAFTHDLLYLDPFWSIQNDFTYDPVTDQTLLSVYNPSYLSNGATADDGGPFPEVALIGPLATPEPGTCGFIALALSFAAIRSPKVRQLALRVVAGALTLLPIALAASDKPPVADIHNVVDDYYGVKLQDPYRYLENLNDPQVAAWFKGQAQYTSDVLATIPGRTALLARIQQLDAGAPALVRQVRLMPGNRLFYQKRAATEETFKLYLWQGWTGVEQLLVDPDKFVLKQGEHNTLNWWSPSRDGNLVAFGISPGGSEAAVLHIVDTRSGALLPDVIDRCQFGSVSWTADNRAFTYNRLQKLSANAPPTGKYENSQVFLHSLGRDPNQDPVVFGRSLPALSLKPTDVPVIALPIQTDFVVSLVSHGTQREVTVFKQPIGKLGSQTDWTKFADVDDGIVDLTTHGNDLYAISQRDASHRQLLAARLTDPSFEHAKVLVPQGAFILEDVTAASDALYIRSTEVGLGKVSRLDYVSHGLQPVPQPEHSSTWSITGDVRVPGLVIGIGSWIHPDAWYSYDPASQVTADTHLQPENATAAHNLQVSEVKVTSHDGTLVPLTIVSRIDLQRDGQNPTLMTGYGAYGKSMDPYFGPKVQAWVERGGVYAVAHIRGGGEYGKDWHLAGKGLTKENTWKDFIACGEYLISQRYTSRQRLGIEGGSAGGITIGRAITERPDLFAAAIDAVPVSDTVRFELSPNGPGNVAEFGTVKNQDSFQGLLAMSPYHHVKDGGNYPAVLLTTGFNDPRVIPWQPGKMAARLQAATASKKPVLLRVDYDAGHGIGSTRQQAQLQTADIYSFLLWQMGVPEFQPPAPASQLSESKQRRAAP